VNKAKPFCISKWEVWEAYKRVKANQGAAGVDGQSIAEFEEELKDNLFKIWNRMSSGSYFPPPVRRVEKPKDNGGTRPLGIPTVADRIAQTVVKRYLEPILEECFHPDSYGYRPKKSAIEAIGVARQHCWRYDWVLDLDIKGFFDSIDHELLLRAARKHTDCKSGASLHRKMAGSPGAIGRWQPDSSGQRDSARRGNQSLACESLFALCVRYVDEEVVSSNSI
jgi:group II intron reverse transcriptase/maturase